jgi:hypothetical protein
VWLSRPDILPRAQAEEAATEGLNKLSFYLSSDHGLCLHEGAPFLIARREGGAWDSSGHMF